MNSSQEGKHAQILSAAEQRFGLDGFKATKWADVAADVGVGATALYHYFDSKQHCLYVLMGRTVEDFRARFEALTAGRSDHLNSLLGVLEDCFALSERDILRLRVIVAEQGLLAVRRTSAGEEQARQAVRARARDLEFAWASSLTRAMEHGTIPESDPRLLARAVLGLYNSVWQWYRPDGRLGLEPVAAFFIGRALALMGVIPEPVDTLRPAA